MFHSFPDKSIVLCNPFKRLSFSSVPLRAKPEGLDKEPPSGSVPDPSSATAQSEAEGSSNASQISQLKADLDQANKRVRDLTASTEASSTEHAALAADRDALKSQLSSSTNLVIPTADIDSKMSKPASLVQPSESSFISIDLFLSFEHPSDWRPDPNPVGKISVPFLQVNLYSTHNVWAVIRYGLTRISRSLNNWDRFFGSQLVYSCYIDLGVRFDFCFLAAFTRCFSSTFTETPIQLASHLGLSSGTYFGAAIGIIYLEFCHTLLRMLHSGESLPSNDPSGYALIVSGVIQDIV